jgi:polysaccharide export outer membrane protein
MIKRLFLAVCLFFLFSFSIAFAQEYIVGEGDVIKITVYDHEDLNTTTRVSGDGTILLPLVGQLEVKGLTLTEITRKIATLLSDGYIVNPQVNIFIQEFRSKKAFIMGEVSKPPSRTDDPSRAPLGSRRSYKGCRG